MTITSGLYETDFGAKAEVIDLRNGIAIGWVGDSPQQWLTNGVSLNVSRFNLTRPWGSDPKFRPWKESEVPLGCRIRAIGGRGISLIIDTASSDNRLRWLIDYEHSADGGKTWKPCGVEVSQ